MWKIYIFYFTFFYYYEALKKIITGSSEDRLDSDLSKMSADVSQAAAMMSESRYAIVVVDSATACYRYCTYFFPHSFSLPIIDWIWMIPVGEFHYWQWQQCCRSVTFWYGSGSESGSSDQCQGSMDPDLDPAPDSAIFVLNLQDAYKNYFFSACYFLKLHLHHFSKIKCHKEVTKQ
jgi:hypothetical protein